MNYIATPGRQGRGLDLSRSIKTEINDLISYLCGDKFRVDTRLQKGFETVIEGEPLLPSRTGKLGWHEGF